MLKTNSKPALINLRKYIADNTSPENYGFEPITEFKPAARFIMTCFYNEKVKNDKRRMNYQDLFIEWLAGLPTVFDSCYYYNRSAKDDIGGILEETEQEKDKFTEEQACDLLSRIIYREILKASDYTVKSFTEWEEK